MYENLNFFGKITAAEDALKNKSVQVQLFQKKKKGLLNNLPHSWKPPTMTNGVPVLIGQGPSTENKINGLVRTLSEQ